MKNFTVLDLLDLDLKENDALSLKCVAGRQGLGNEITMSFLDRPGLALIGFFDNFTYQRIQIFGIRESNFIEKMEKEQNFDFQNIEKFFSYQIPCCIFSTGLQPGEKIKAIASKANCPLLVTPLSTTELTRRLARILGSVFAPKQLIYGDLVEVYGLGILIQGKSGVGKSETALELIERGHRLIADDVVEIRNLYGFLMKPCEFIFISPVIGKKLFRIVINEILVLMIAGILKILGKSRQFICTDDPCGCLQRMDLNGIEFQIIRLVSILYHL